MTEERVLQIPMADVRPSKDNRREAGDVRELAESIKAQGLLQPIVTRVIDGVKHEIICGERRYLACKSLGMQTITCKVVQVSDEQAAEMRAVENLQRKDLAPMESAEEISRLLDGGKSMQEIADALGKPVPWVAKRAKLMDLSKDWKEAVTTNQAPGWTPSMLELVARMNPEIQGEIFECYIERDWGGTPTLDEIREIGERATFLLSAAKWKLDDPTIDTKSGSCKSCSIRTGAQANLFDEYDSTKADDRCLDPECFKRKAAAFLEKRESELREKNQDLVLIGNRYEAENKESLKGKTILDQYAVNQAKKGEAGAVQALVVTGEKAGTVKWIKIPKGEKGKAVAGAGPKSLKEKRAQLETRRKKAFIQKAIDLLDEEMENHDLIQRVSEYDFYSALVAFGAEEWITASGGGYTRDKWKQFDELSGTTEDRKYRMGMMMSCIVPKMKSLLVNNMSFDPSLGRADAERTFQFFGYNKNDIDAIRSKVAEEIPEPKAWAAQEEAESACALEEKPKRLSSKKKSKK